MYWTSCDTLHMTTAVRDGSDVVRAFERTTVRVVSYWTAKSGFLEESVYRVADHSTHTADFAGAFFLVSAFAQRVHLVFVCIHPRSNPRIAAGRTEGRRL